MNHALRLLLGLSLGAVMLCANVSVSAETSTKVLAPGYGPLEYVPPPAGSYELPPLGKAVDGAVINKDGKALRLHDVVGDKLVVMGFIYTHCPDVNGCPLASYVMKQLQMRLLIRWARANPTITRIELDVFATNRAAINLYLKHGFVVAGCRRQAYFTEGHYIGFQFGA